MKLKDILSNLDLSKQEDYCINDEFLSEFEDHLFEHQIDYKKSKFKEIWLICWYCTDSRVGTRVILLDNIPICISNQDGRKSDQEFQWVSKVHFELASKHVEEIKLQQDKQSNISTLNLEEDQCEFYKICFPEQLLSSCFHKFGFYGNQKVSIEKIKPDDYRNNNVKITLSSGETKIVDVSEIDFPLLNINL